MMTIEERHQQDLTLIEGYLNVDRFDAIKIQNIMKNKYGDLIWFTFNDYRKRARLDIYRTEQGNS